MQKFPTDRRSVFSFFGLESFDESALIQMNLFNKEIYTAKMHNYFNGNCAYLPSPPTRGRELKLKAVKNADGTGSRPPRGGVN